jgi:uncharacterized protein
MATQPGPQSLRLFVDGYGNGGFRIGGERHEGSLFVLPGRVLGWAVTAFAEADVAGFEPFLEAAADVELLLIGAGPRLLPVPGEVRAACRRAGIAVEPMDTGAAARTYNVLLAEDRRVAAALIAV